MTTTVNGTAPTARPPLFAKPIPIIGVTGEFEAGKTRFLMSIAPGPDTCIFDTEASSESYEEVGAFRVDLPKKMLEVKPSGYKQLDMFEWWRDAIKTIPPGRFRVIALDVAEDIEAGLADWVWEHPLQFNHTRQQYIKMSGLYWNDVKAMWKPILLDLRSRCEVFAFAVHTGSVWANDKPTGAKRPKGKSTLMELASLFLFLERPTQADGGRQEVPSARVLKSRLSHNRIRPDGGLDTKAILPPRIPEATVEAIRAYIARPADYTRLTDAEKAVPQMMTDDERAAVRLATAQAEAETEALRLQRMAEERKADGGGVLGDAEGDFDSPAPTQPHAAPLVNSPMWTDTPAAATQSPTPTPLPPVQPPSPTTAPPPPAEPPAAVTVPRGLRGRIAESVGKAPKTIEQLAAEFSEIASRAQVEEGVRLLVGAKTVHIAGNEVRKGRGRFDVEFVPEPALADAPASHPEPESVHQTPAGGTATATIVAPAPVPTPATSAPSAPAYVRPASLGPPGRSTVLNLWEELAMANNWSFDQKQAIWSAAVLAKYGCITGNELTDENLAEIEQMLVMRIDDAYVEQGRPNASPFANHFRPTG